MTRLHDYTSLGAHYEKTQMCPLRQGKSLFQISDHSGHLTIVRQTRCRQLRQAECNSKDTRSVPVLMLQTMPRTWLIASPRFFLKSVETEAGVRLMANVRAGSSSLDLPLDQCLCFNCLIPTGRASYASLLVPPASPQPAMFCLTCFSIPTLESSSVRPSVRWTLRPVAPLLALPAD